MPWQFVASRAVLSPSANWNFRRSFSPFLPIYPLFPSLPPSFRSFPFHLLSSASGAFVSEDISESLGQIDISAFKVDRIPILMLARAIRSVLYMLVLYKLKRNHRSHQFSNLRVFHRSFETRYYLTSRFYRQLFPFPPNYPRVGYSTREFRVLELAGDDFHKILLSNQSVGSGGRIIPRKPVIPSEYPFVQ